MTDRSLRPKAKVYLDLRTYVARRALLLVKNPSRLYCFDSCCMVACLSSVVAVLRRETRGGAGYLDVSELSSLQERAVLSVI